MMSQHFWSNCRWQWVIPCFVGMDNDIHNPVGEVLLGKSTPQLSTSITQNSWSDIRTPVEAAAIYALSNLTGQFLPVSTLPWWRINLPWQIGWLHGWLHGSRTALSEGKPHLATMTLSVSNTSC